VSNYNRVLSSSEILQNYNAQKGRFGLWSIYDKCQTQ
jgi:hypothetical protein